MEIEIVIAVIILLALVLLATVDMAFSRLSDVSLRRLASDVEENDNRTSEMLREMLENRPRYRFALSATIQILLIVYSVILTLLLLRFVDDRTRLLLAALVIGLGSTVVFRQIVPRIVVASNPDKRLLFFLPIVGPLFSLVSKLAAPFDARMTAKERLKMELTAAPDSSDDRTEDSADDFQALMEVGEAEGIIEEKEREMIETLVEFSDTRVGEIMTPRTEICALPVKSTVKDARDLIVEEKYSRLPVYRDSIDNIEGMIYVRDLMQAWAEGKEDKPVSTILRDAFFIPETKTASELLKDMQLNHVQVAIVIDEYGGVAGLITVEDILEEIVGDIKDEHDIAVQGVRQQPDGSVNVDGGVPIRDLNRAMNWDLPDEEAVTIAGLVIHEAQAIPEPGQRFAFHGYRFQVLRRQRNQLTALRVEREVEEGMEGG